MKVLITGCTAQQASPEVHKRNPTFAGLIFHALSQSGVDVTWQPPSVKNTKEYLSTFDIVMVGISSPLSVTSNWTYGGFYTAEIAKNIGNLYLFIDSPEPQKILKGLKVIKDKPENLTKKFFSSRKDYSLAKTAEISKKIMSFNSYLLEEEWPKTFAPSIPWVSPVHVLKYIPNLEEKNLSLISVDSFLLDMALDKTQPVYDPQYWLADNINSNWTARTKNTVVNGVIPMKSNKWEGNANIMNKLQNAYGTLITTYQNNDPWWSLGISQSLLMGVPVVTDWRLSQSLGNDWSVLASHLEELTSEDRLVIANNQKVLYKKEIPDWEESKEIILAEFKNLKARNTYSIA